MKFKEMSKFNVILIKTNYEDYCMNLHEECLLKYLSNPMNLVNSTELLKMNNMIIEKSLLNRSKRAKASNISYSASRV